MGCNDQLCMYVCNFGGNLKHSLASLKLVKYCVFERYLKERARTQNTGKQAVTSVKIVVI